MTPTYTLPTQQPQIPAEPKTVKVQTLSMTVEMAFGEIILAQGKAGVVSIKTPNQEIKLDGAQFALRTHSGITVGSEPDIKFFRDRGIEADIFTILAPQDTEIVYTEMWVGRGDKRIQLALPKAIVVLKDYALQIEILFRRKMPAKLVVTEQDLKGLDPQMVADLKSGAGRERIRQIKRTISENQVRATNKTLMDATAKQRADEILQAKTTNAIVEAAEECVNAGLVNNIDDAKSMIESCIE